MDNEPKITIMTASTIDTPYQIVNNNLSGFEVVGGRELVGLSVVDEFEVKYLF